MNDCPGTGIEEMIYSLLNPLSKEERTKAIDVLQKIIRKEMFGEIGAGVISCPKCHSEEHQLFGHDHKGRQRYRCKECDSIFTEWSNCGILKNSKLPLEKWEAFLPAFIDGLSCDKVAERIEVTHKTAWFMRIRVLEALYRNLPSFQVKDGCGAYIDEFYLHESFKGVSFKHLGDMPREPRHSSKGVNIRGISNEQICVVTGINDSGDFFYDVSCRGAFTKEAAEKTLKDRLESGSIINTDKHHSYQKVVSHICGATHISNGPQDHSALKPVNDLHSAIKNFLRMFNGVSTKWLHSYMIWYKWLKVFKDQEHKIEDLLRKQISHGDYDHKWKSINKMDLPFRDTDLNATKF